jgi:tRNA1Val (adenine37-N6)-methyltransferase
MGVSGMRNKNQFRFKKFSVYHDRSTMKVGTDAVLLGAWAKIGDAIRILDIGAGSGTIALMLAQRSHGNAHIDAVEIEGNDVQQAKENFVNSPWPTKIEVHHSSIQEFVPDIKYHLIISNPPYFNNSQSPRDEKRYNARHTVKLNHQELISAVVRLLDANGKFNVVLPFEEGLQFSDLAETKMLYCSRRYSFKTRAEKKIERWLMEFTLKRQPVETGEILLYKNDEIWHESYINLTKDFYLKL